MYLREIGDDWRAVADVAPRDEQRQFVFGLALRSSSDAEVIRLSYHLDNTAADALYSSLGFAPTGTMADDEIVVECPTPDAGHDAAG